MRVPLIIVDPRESANASRGTVSNALVEAIDLVPTFLEATGAPAAEHRLEGRSLMPLIKGEQPLNWRSEVFSEIDYAFYTARETLAVAPSDARGYMLRSDRWKYIHFKGYRPQLFDLQEDPDEFNDLGASDVHAEIRLELKEKLFDRLTDRKNRVTMTDEQVIATRAGESGSGIVIGRW